METVTITKFKCSTCGELYNTKEEAESCESKKITQDKGVKIGDTVLITSGEGTGQKAIVERKWIVSKYWEHYAWERYWHTVSLSVKIIGGCRNKVLTFDQYEPA